ncbi:RagB/SusD family nutrient uptake outer membrane protein [Maribacter polysiphoniae]|uniref:RagB/SusD family nutrient uptake outer membrane protein n=1 Tax=Maribacter polysiphoniae TaxID=429344 RepID=UPI0023543E61|nr:RagB/SusD family nutrient uptake outer membrane protein [Maribacter polysiphoniae]
MKNNNIIVALLLCISLVGCVKLEEDTASILSISELKTEEDFDAALSPIFARIATANKDAHKRMTAAGADDLTTWNGGNKAPIRLFDGFGYGNGVGAELEWLTFYSWDPYWDVIYSANNVIVGAEKSTGEESVKNLAIANAKFARAISYFDLVRTFGGLPLILDLDADGSESRSTVLEVYEAIESDLLFAATYLPAPGAVSSIGKPSNAAAKAWLSSLYLTWGGWPVKDVSKYDLAASTAKEIIDLGYFELLPIDELWLLESENSKESIFSIQYSTGDNNFQLMPQSFLPHTAGGWSDFFAELDFYNRFPEGPRKEATFLDSITIREAGTLDPIETVHWTNSEATQRYNPVYRKYTESEVAGYDTKMVSFRALEFFRYAEVLLIYAEAQARSSTGATAASIEALNQVKRRAAGLPYLISNVSVDVATATPNEIVDESGWELAGEFKRWFDLVRTERVEEIAALRDPAEKVVLVGTPSKSHYLAPLPLKAVEGTNLIQNP